MSEWKTVIRADSIQQAHMIRTQLELHGFEVLILDELSTQVTPHYSIATGGARIQVPAADLEKATECLIELEYIFPEEDKKPSWIARIVNCTSKIPLAGKMRFEMTLILIIFVAVIAIAIILPVLLTKV